jgi:hypothetical protein
MGAHYAKGCNVAPRFPKYAFQDQSILLWKPINGRSHFFPFSSSREFQNLLSIATIGTAGLFLIQAHTHIYTYTHAQLIHQYQLDHFHHYRKQVMKFTVPLSLLLGSLLTSSYALPLGNIPQALQVQSSKIAERTPPSELYHQDNILTRRAPAPDQQRRRIHPIQRR